MRHPVSLKQSLTLHFMVVATLPILLLGIFSHRYLEKKHLETIAGLIDNHAVDVSRVAGEFFHDIAVSLALVEKTLDSGLLRNAAEINRYLQLTVSTSGLFESIYLLDENHRVTHLGLSERSRSKRSDSLGLDFSGHEIFRPQGRLTEWTWSNTLLSTVTGEPSILLGIPLAKGTLLGKVGLQQLSAKLADRLQFMGADYQFSLLDRHGMLIAASRPELAAQRLNLRQHPEVRNALDHQIEVPSKFHEDGSLLESVRLVPTTGWAAYVSLPVEVAKEGLAPLRTFLASALGFSGGLGLVLALWLSRRMAQPILQVRDAAREVTSGRYHHVPQSSALQEIEEMRASFGEMLAALEGRENAIKRSEARFRSLVAVMGEGLIILGDNGEIVQCNQAAERVLKKAADDIIGSLCEQLMPNAVDEDGLPIEPDQFPTALTQASGKAINNRIMGLAGADGRVVWLQINTHPLGVDSLGKPLATVLSFADVTRLKRTEEELRHKEKTLLILTQQFKGVLDAIPDQILVVDRNMKMVWLNRQIDQPLAGQEAVVGIPCRELPQVLCGPAAGHSPPLCASCPIKQVFATGCNAEARMCLKDGRTLSLRAFPVCDQQGEVINVIETVQDITAALNQQTQAMRTGQLAALGELAAGVAHEINNPINGVINYAQLILNKAAADSREQDLSQRIIRESERIATIVRELLYFAREESDEIHKVSVCAALDEALALTRNQLDKEGVNLQIRLPEDLPQVLSRSHQVQQLLLNLISNARHALNEKYPDADPDKVLLVSGEQIMQADRPLVRILLRDHGIGIPAELLPRVINPFVTTKSSAEGTGLGLSISHDIVHKHGGTLTIESVQGEFTEISVTLPAAQG